MSSDYAFAPPPTTAATPRRRPHEHHPPALSTTLSAIQRFGSHLTGQTPSSATSTSSPFAGYNPATFSASSVGPSSHRVSPPSRGGSAYNPQQWPAVQGSPLAGARHTARSGTVDEDGGLSPPPPYSPQRPSPDSQNAISPFSSPNSTRNQTPLSMAVSGHATISPPAHSQSSPPSAASQQQFPPPPLPPSSGRRDRSSSRTRPERSNPLLSLSALSSRNRSSTQVSAGDQISPHAPDVLGSRASGPSHTISQAHPRFQQSNPLAHEASIASRPPASRRAASTGAIGIAGPPVRSRAESRSPTRLAWEPGMPLPPPPPGPPPHSRSQSMSRSNETLLARDRDVLPKAPHTRRPGPVGSRLPAVPPTPADWVDEDTIQSLRAQSHQGNGLHIDTELASNSSIAGRSVSRSRDKSSSQSSNDNHAETAQDQGHKGIRERRSESRTRREMNETQSAVEPSGNPWVGHMKPADLVLPNVGSSGLSRRRAVTKSIPRSGRSMQTPDGLPSSASSNPSSGAVESSSTRNTTPQPDSSRTIHSPRPLAPTPPFSPGTLGHNSSPALPPKALPTPPPQSSGSGGELTQAQNRHRTDQMIRSPGTDRSTSSLSLRPISSSSGGSQAAELFARSAVDRHRLFAEREAAAETDRERVQLFADFIVGESRVRRDRYAGAIDAMGSEILELTRDLFRPSSKSTISSPEPRDEAGSSHQGSLNSTLQEPMSPLPSPARPERSSQPGYKPCLSPILSMSVSEAPDIMSSRGRPSSRWWENSQEGSETGGGKRRLERSRRESKYMGLPLRAWDDSDSSGRSTAGPSNAQSFEYPPEKVGWHDQPMPVSSDPRKLDVSRLVTLPPPYPRHYPGVNNNHPDLTTIRGIVRRANDLSVANGIKDAFHIRSQEVNSAMETKRTQMRQGIRQKVEEGTMSYAEAARVEQDGEQREHGKVKAEFERYQDEVMTPLQTMFQEQIEQASASFRHLRGHLLEHQSSPMEEGDEKPELLERLTLMKWLFEALEQLYREQYELMSERSERYKAVVIAPYQGSGGQSRTPTSPTSNADKIRDVEAFFAQDRARRRLAFDKETLGRYEAFMDVVEEKVKRGVEVQLSAFWDIAPSLVELIQRVDVARGVQIPDKSGSNDGGGAFVEGHEEFAFSQQYLWEVLCHAEKSSYQFIEGQVNLLCLLHEVKSGMAKQGCRVMEAEALTESGGGGRDRAGGTELDRSRAIAAQLAMMQREEEDRLTVDLKDKVGVVERQWDEAMGKEVTELKVKVKAWLVRNGGWEAVEED